MANTEIQLPMVKTVSALATGAGASATSIVHQAQSFLPTDLTGWLACLASLIAICYTACLWGEWWWKRVFGAKKKRR